jgi:hypothetical protein
MEKEKEKKMAPVSDAATRRRRMRQGVSGRERVGSRRFGKEEFERRLRVMKKAHLTHNHASATKLNEMVKAGEIEGGMLVTTAMLNCPSCWQAKMTKPRSSTICSNRPNLRGEILMDTSMWRGSSVGEAVTSSGTS